MNNTVRLTTNESGDYAMLSYGDFQEEGHVIDYAAWLNLIKYLGYRVERHVVSDEEMENMCYEA